MATNSTLGRIAAWYIRRGGVVGMLYGVVPALLWFGFMFATIPFRPVYLVRLVLSLLIAGVAGWILNKYGLNMWLLKHRSKQGPAGSIDGMLIGASIGMGIALLPPLTSLIGTHHIEEAKWFIIFSWLAAVLIGACNGIVMGAIGRNNIDRQDS